MAAESRDGGWSRDGTAGLTHSLSRPRHSPFPPVPIGHWCQSRVRRAAADAGRRTLFTEQAAFEPDPQRPSGIPGNTEDWAQSVSTCLASKFHQCLRSHTITTCCAHLMIPAQAPVYHSSFLACQCSPCPFPRVCGVSGYWFWVTVGLSASCIKPWLLSLHRPAPHHVACQSLAVPATLLRRWQGSLASFCCLHLCQADDCFGGDRCPRKSH